MNYSYRKSENITKCCAKCAHFHITKTFYRCSYQLGDVGLLCVCNNFLQAATYRQKKRNLYTNIRGD